MTALDPLSFKGALFSALPSVLVPTPDQRRLTSLDFESLEQSCFPSRRTAQQKPKQKRGGRDFGARLPQQRGIRPNRQADSWLQAPVGPPTVTLCAILLENGVLQSSDVQASVAIPNASPAVEMHASR